MKPDIMNKKYDSTHPLETARAVLEAAKERTKITHTQWGDYERCDVRYRDPLKALEVEIAWREAQDAEEIARREVGRLAHVHGLGDPEDARLADLTILEQDCAAIMAREAVLVSEACDLERQPVTDAAVHAQKVAHLRTEAEACCSLALNRFKSAIESWRRLEAAAIEAGVPKPGGRTAVRALLISPAGDVRWWFEHLQALLRDDRPEPLPNAERLDRLRLERDEVYAARELAVRSEEKRQAEFAERAEAERKAREQSAKHLEKKAVKRAKREREEAEAAAQERAELAEAYQRRQDQPAMPLSDAGTPSRTDKVQPEAPAREHHERPDGAI